MVSDVPKTQIIGEPVKYYIPGLIIEDKYIYVRLHFSSVGWYYVMWEELQASHSKLYNPWKWALKVFLKGSVGLVTV